MTCTLCGSGITADKRKEDMIEQLAGLMDTIDLDEISIKGKAISRVADVDIRNYAKYILRDGTIIEKRELLTCLRSRVTMANKVIKIVDL